MGLREFNEYKISLLVRKDESNSGDLILQLPKTYAEGVWVRRQKETVLHHVESMIVHCTAKDHILLNTINQPKAFVVLDKDGYLGNDHFNPILIGINEEYPTFERLLATTLYTSPHDIGRVVMVLDASDYPDVKKRGSWATFRYRGGNASRAEAWEKIAEEESIEFSFSWKDLHAPFRSTLEQIDNLGKVGHTHETIETLNKLSASLGHLYFGDIKIRHREEIAAYKVTTNLMSNDLFAGDCVMYVTGENLNPKMDPNGNPINTSETTYPHQAQIINPETLTLHGDVSGFYEDNQDIIKAPKIKCGQVSKMNRFFANCHELVYVPWYDTSDTVEMKEMFLNCEKLGDIPTFPTDKVRDMSSMFEGCESLKSIPKTNLLTLEKANRMFKGCTTFNNAPDFFTPVLRECREMFSGCTNLEHMPALNTTMVKDLTSLFEGCTHLADYYKLDTSSASSMVNMFKDCRELKGIYDIDMGSCKDATDMLTGCRKLNVFRPKSRTIKCNLDVYCQSVNRALLTDIVTGLADMNHDPKEVHVYYYNESADVTSNIESIQQLATVKGWTLTVSAVTE